MVVLVLVMIVVMLVCGECIQRVVVMVVLKVHWDGGTCRGAGGGTGGGCDRGRCARYTSHATCYLLISVNLHTNRSHFIIILLRNDYGLYVYSACGIRI